MIVTVPEPRDYAAERERALKYLGNKYLLAQPARPQTKTAVVVASGACAAVRMQNRKQQS